MSDIGFDGLAVFLVWGPIALGALASLVWVVPILIWKGPTEGRAPGRRWPVVLPSVVWIGFYALIMGGTFLRLPALAFVGLGWLMVLGTGGVAVMVTRRAVGRQWPAGAIGAANVAISLCCLMVVMLLFGKG